MVSKISALGVASSSNRRELIDGDFLLFTNVLEYF